MKQFTCNQNYVDTYGLFLIVIELIRQSMLKTPVHVHNTLKDHRI